MCDRPAVFRCGRCRSERYCSRECQKDASPHHKTHCTRAANTGAGVGEAGGDAAGTLQPQPPPIAPQPPASVNAPPQRVGASSNPRAARLLGNLPPPDPEPPPSAAANAAGTQAKDAVDAVSGGPGAPGPMPSPHAPHPATEGALAVGPRAPPAPPPTSPSPPPPRPPPRPPSAGGPQPGRSRPMPHLREGRAPTGDRRSRDGGSILDRLLPPPTPPPVLAPLPSALAPAATAAADATPASSTSPTTAPSSSPPGSAPSEPRLWVWPWAPQPHSHEAHAPAAATGAAAGGSAAAAAAHAKAASQLGDLPLEVLLEVLKALPARSLAAAASVCRAWRSAAREPWLWVRHLCAAGYPLPVAAYVAEHRGGSGSGGGSGGGAPASEGGAGAVGSPEGAAQLHAVAGVRGVRAVRALRAAGGDGGFLGGLQAGFLDRLQQQAATQGTQVHMPRPPAEPPPEHAERLGAPGPRAHGPHHQQQHNHHHHHQQPACDLKGLYGRTVRLESNWRNARYAEMPLREHASNVECLAFQEVAPWGSVLLSAAWDGSVRVFALGPPDGAPQQARCVRRYRGHTGWVTSLAPGRFQVVTASTDRRAAAWRYADEGPEPWALLEHPAEVTTVRFAYAPPPPATMQLASHHVCAAEVPASGSAVGGGAGSSGGESPQRPAQTQPQPAHSPVGATAHAPSMGPRPPASSAASGAAAADEPGAVRWRDNPCALLIPGAPYDPAWEDWVVTGAVDGAMRLWHLPTKQLIRILSGHVDVVWGVHVLQPDSSVLVSSSRDGTTKLWQLPPYAEMHAAVQAAAATDARGSAGGGDRGTGAAAEQGAARGGGAPQPPQTLDALATLCGHSSAVLCMDAHRVPPGVMPPRSAPTSVVSASGSGITRPEDVLAAHADMLASLTHLLNAPLVSAAGALGGTGAGGGRQVAGASRATGAGSAASGGGGGSSGTLAAVTRAQKTAAAAAAAVGALPTWLVATGGADAVVRVWDLGAARCVSTLRGHAVGVLSVKFGYLPRSGEAPRNAALLPPDLDVSSAAPPPSMRGLVLPPGQYGEGAAAVQHGSRRQVMPPAHRLVLVTGSVREVRVWDPLSGACLAALADHAGPVTTIGISHGMLVTLAMNDGLCVYKCVGGIDGGGARAESSGGAGAGPGGGGGGGDVPVLGAGDAGEPRRSDGGGGGASASSAAERLRQAVAANRRVLEPVICMQDPVHHAFAAALAVHVEGLAVGSGTAITYLDFRPRGSLLPAIGGRSGRQQRQQQQLDARAAIMQRL